MQYYLKKRLCVRRICSCPYANAHCISEPNIDSVQKRKLLCWATHLLWCGAGREEQEAREPSKRNAGSVVSFSEVDMHQYVACRTVRYG
jgi:hypothetical protein